MADLKHLARLIFHATLAAIGLPAGMQRKVRVEGSQLHCGDITVELRGFSKICVVAIGKAAHAMLEGLRSALPSDFKFEGVACGPTPAAPPLPRIKYFVGG